ncbi:sialic acid TRAP transporter substrate-binding protein SiaP [Gilvimarinus agarilyticus]|uniref:sialic acid TRAP transporter substrate-binding protein SiaP n=1 Tax=Gilvimarinus sp. 2_MG-2023 TaxID=3062666 RepID=UPI001C081DDF|nr:sialic acid TRAP transporter substrate-binding protein SiaP [Gilvimarinus sp. 2_MG-2023]MBU2887719.1 sialic acid TRAP transporter substrate-binding protein SiaP [Gilvimarinus agarilyticus]MDO6572366.1 sialic acid TRAP transporter substrate-binding protein SiaP [Gilvimarinus sp. 2_MG-2023]
MLLSIAKSLLFISACFFVVLPSGAAEQRRILWAHVYELSEPLHQRALWAAGEIEKRTQGRYKIDVFPMSTLGKEAQLNQSLSLGIVDIIYTGTSFAAQNFPALSIPELPYAFRDFEHWQDFSQSQLFFDMADEYRERSNGNHILGCSYYGQRHLTSNFPVIEPEQMKNLKVRVPNASVYKVFPKAMSANASPIAFSEVYLALQQGVVDAQENPLPTIRAKKFYEVNKHINLTGHIFGSILTLASDRLWKELSNEDQEIFSDVLAQAARGVTEDTRIIEDELIGWFKSQGVTVNTVNRNAFREQTLPFHAEHKVRMGADYYQRLQDI